MYAGEMSTGGTVLISFGAGDHKTTRRVETREPQHPGRAPGFLVPAADVPSGQLYSEQNEPFET